jgi:hypothetical protein
MVNGGIQPARSIDAIRVRTQTMTDNSTGYTTEPAAEETRDTLNQFLNHQRRAFDEASKAVDSLIPPGFKEHGAEASREFVKGFKVLVDATIDGLQKASSEMGKRAERASGGNDQTGTGAAKIKVQVE